MKEIARGKEDDMNAEYTGKKIAELRKEKGLTQKELANKLHVTDKAVSKWERGVNFPDLGLMEALAEALDTTPSILLGLENSTKEEIVTSFAEISTLQNEEGERDIQKVGWGNLFAGIFLMIFMYFINIKLQRNGLYFESEGLLWGIYILIVTVVVGALYTLRKYKAIKKWETLEMVLTEVIVVDAVIFLAIQFFTGSNPNYIVSSILIGIASVGLQVLFYRVMRPQWMRMLPMLGMTTWMCWGLLLELSEPAWMDDRMWSVLVYNVLPAVCCIITWFICRKRDKEKENMIPIIKRIAAFLLIIIAFLFLFAQDLLVKTYVKVFHSQLESYAQELLDRAEKATEGDVSVYLNGDSEIYMVDRYGFWKVNCYPEDGLVEFHTGGAGLVANSTYEGFYYSQDNSHKVFQSADISLNVNKNLADWYGEGDNWGKSTRLMEKWFWFEANF